MNRSTSRITDDMFARIPAMLFEGMTKGDIAAKYGVTLGTLTVLCSRRGVSLRKGGALPKRTYLTLPHGWSATSWRRSPAMVSTRQCWTRSRHDDLASARLGAS